MAHLFERAVIAGATFMIATSVQAAPTASAAPARAESGRALQAPIADLSSRGARTPAAHGRLAGSPPGPN